MDHDNLRPLGRVIQVQNPDTSVVQTTYAGKTATVKDEADKFRELTTDALGRLVQVREDPSGLNYATIYGYDLLDNLN